MHTSQGNQWQRIWGVEPGRIDYITMDIVLGPLGNAMRAGIYSATGHHDTVQKPVTVATGDDGLPEEAAMMS